MNTNPTQAVRSSSHRSRFVAGLAVSLVSLAIGIAWQFRSRSDTGNSVNRLRIAKQHLAEGRLDLAEVALQAHLDEKPNSTEALEELRWLYFNQLRTREIEDTLEAHLVRFPDDFMTAIELLNCEYRKQLPREGIGYLREIDRKQPGQASVQLALGYCFWQIGELDNARTSLQAALSRRPNHRQTRYIVVEFQLENGETESAAELVAEVVSLTDDKNDKVTSHVDRDDDRVWFLRSLIAEQQGNVELAYRDIECALSKRPGELRYVHREGLLLLRLGRPKEALQKLRRANELEGFQSELSEIVLRGRHTEPTPELCERLADLLHEFGHTIQSQTWRRLGPRLQSPMRGP